MTSPLPIDTILDITTMHPLWFVTKINKSQNHITFHPYIHQHPIGVSPFAFRSTVTRINLNWGDGRFELSPGKHGDTQYAQHNRSDLRTAFTNTVRQVNPHIKDDHIDRLFGYNKPLPDPVKDTMHSTFSSHYDIISSNETELMQIDGIGEKRAENVLSPSTKAMYHCDWASYTICPACDHEFWSVYPQRDHKNINPKTHPNPLSRLSQLTYCPACDTTTIPTSHMMSPTQFTPENIQKHTPQATDDIANTTSPKNQTLSSF